MNILDVNISCFKDYNTPGNPRTVNMLTWLRSDKYAADVIRIRSTADKEQRNELKGKLPAITPSGLFLYRNSDPANFIKHSGLLQFDIDMKGNEHIGNYKDLKTHICNIQNVAYCGLSVSGGGYWGLVPITYPEHHTRQFWALYNAFQKLGLTLDTRPKDKFSLRGYSFDPEGYFNHNAKPFASLADDPAADPPKPFRQFQRCHRGNDTRVNVEALIYEIQAGRTDITAGYDQWLRIGFALADEFGESGREYFHAISQYHPQYSKRGSDQQYTNCLQARGGGVTIATLFHACKEHGIIIRDNPVSIGDRSTRGKYESPESTPHGYNPYTGEIFDERGYPGSWDTLNKLFDTVLTPQQF